jgi:hypothetical protein
MRSDQLTLSRPLRRRDALIALVLLCAAIAFALWRSEVTSFPDTVRDRPSSAGAAPHAEEGREGKR